MSDGLSLQSLSEALIPRFENVGVAQGLFLYLLKQ